jgi:putative restriction endonuclease
LTEATPVYLADPRQASLGKTLADTGFDRPTRVGEGWLRGASLGSTLVVHVRWVGATIELAIPRVYLLAPVLAALEAGGGSGKTTDQRWSFREVPVAVSSAVAAGNQLAEFDDATAVPVVEVSDLPSLHTALAAAFRATQGIGIPPPLEAFTTAIRGLPRVTEVEYLIMQRVGQGLFREALLRRWNGRCAVTGVDVPELLRASHIKPWARCTSDAERLDPDNGLLLVANWDAAFDQGLVTFADAGSVIWSVRLPAPLREKLGMTPCSLPSQGAATRRYLEWHRQYVFKDHSQCEPDDHNPPSS